MQPVAAWINLLGSDDIEIRVRAARRLVIRDDVPLDTLVVISEELSDHGLGAGVRRALLGRTDPELFDRMIGSLDSPGSSARVTACEVLGKLGRRQAAPRVLELLTDSNWRVRRAAITTLGKLGDDSAVPPLRQQFLDVGADVNMEIALHGALKQLGALDGLPPPSWSKPPMGPTHGG